MSQVEPYAQRVYEAYRELSAQYQSPDVRIDALHAKVRGNLDELHRWLRQACQDHLAVPSTGEPSMAGHAARQSALHLPGEREAFLRIKLLQPPIMSQPQQRDPQPQGPPRPAALSRDDLAVIIEALEYRCDSISGGTDFDEVARLKSIVPTLEKLRAIEALPQAAPEHERYERLLRATAELRYPKEERTPELEARIERTIARKVSDFLQEQQLRERVKLYENSLQRQLDQKRPQLTPEKVEHFERKIQTMVNQYRQAQRQQTPQLSATRSQTQGREIER